MGFDSEFLTFSRLDDIYFISNVKIYAAYINVNDCFEWQTRYLVASDDAISTTV